MQCWREGPISGVDAAEETTVMVAGFYDVERIPNDMPRMVSGTAGGLPRRQPTSLELVAAVSGVRREANCTASALIPFVSGA